MTLNGLWNVSILPGIEGGERERKNLKTWRQKKCKECLNASSLTRQCCRELRPEKLGW